MNERQLVERFGNNWVLGSLPSGHEWVAFTFRDQDFNPDFADELQRMVGFSEERLKDAYSRMDMENHPWAKHASKEIEALESIGCSFDGMEVLDAGCGRGRHSLEIAHRHPTSSVAGVDFSESNISCANSKKGDIDNVSFEVADLRDYNPIDSFDVIICLYDVIGSFPDDSDNNAIFNNIALSCKKGGISSSRHEYGADEAPRPTFPYRGRPIRSEDVIRSASWRCYA